MTIPVKRFDIFDEETNLAVQDFFTADDSSILNSANNEYKSITKDIKNFLDNIYPKEDINELESLGKDIQSGIRSVKAAKDSIVDTLNQTMDEVNQTIADMAASSPIAGALLNQLNPKCKKKAAGHRRGGRPHKPQMPCGGGSQYGNGSDQCAGGADAFSRALGKLTSGVYDRKFTDSDKLMSSIMGLANIGYGLNMCNVFSALASTIGSELSDSMLSEVSSDVLGGIIDDANELGVFDMASSVGALGLFPDAFNPNIAAEVLGNFSIPTGTREKNFGSLADRAWGSLDILDKGWDASKYDGLPSISAFGGSSSDGVMNIFASKEMGSCFGEDDLGSIPSDDFSFMNTALRMA